jgi:hypothetical protein
VSEKGSDELLREAGTWPRVVAEHEHSVKRQQAFSLSEDAAVDAANAAHDDELGDAEHQIDG